MILRESRIVFRNGQCLFIENRTGLITLIFIEDFDFTQLHLVSKDNFSLIISSFAFIPFALMKFRVSFSSSEDTCLGSGSKEEEKLQESSKKNLAKKSRNNLANKHVMASVPQTLSSVLTISGQFGLYSPCS